jgi:ribonuclease BN (tRNA processing enzyme)
LSISDRVLCVAPRAVLDRYITALEPANLKVALVTHLHSDHTAGYSDLILTGWTAGRRTPLEVYGPAGLQSMTEHILQAYRIDIETRTGPEGDQRSNPEGWRVNAHEIKSGVIYKDAKVTVTRLPHETRPGELRIPIRHPGPQRRDLRRYQSYRGDDQSLQWL